MGAEKAPLALVVEDEDGICVLLKARLEDAGLEVVCAASAEEAEKFLAAGCPDVVLLDYSLPGKDGGEFLRYLKSLARACAFPPPVIITTGRGDERLAVELMKLGASDYLVKDGEFLGRVVPVTRRALQEGQLKKELAEQQNRFREIFEFSGVAKAITLPDGTIDPNKALCDLLGYSAAEFAGKTWTEFTPEPDRARSAELLAGLASGKEDSARLEQPYLRKDGAVVWGDVSIRAKRDPAGRLEYFITAIVDITARRRAEAALKQQADLLRLAGKAANFGGWRLDLVKGEVVWSEAVAVLHDLPPDFSPKLEQASDFCAPEYRERMRRAAAECAASGKGFDEELEIITAKGRRLWVRAIGMAERDAAGKVVGVFGSLQDIDERKRLDLRLAAALAEAARFRDAMDRVPVYVFIKDLQGRYVYGNALTLKLFGCDAAGLAGRTDDDFFPPEAVRLIKEKDAAVFAGRQSSAEIPVRGKDGAERLYFESKTPLYADEEKTRVAGLLGVTTDVTELRRVERELKESETFNKMLLDNLPIGVAVNSVKPGVEFSYMNDKFPALYRTTRERLAKPGSFWEAVYEDPEVRARIRERVEADVKSGDPARMRWEDVPIRRGGRTWYVSAQDTPLPGKDLVISTVWDVTDRNEALQALQERARELLDSQRRARLGVYKLDLRTRRFEVSEVLEEMYGIGKDYPRDMAGWAGLLHPEDAEQVRGKMEDVIAGRAVEYRSEHRIVRPDGKVIWVNSRARLENGPDGLPACLSGTVLDITERRLAEISLRESEETFRRLVEHSPDGVIIQLEGRHEYLNPEALRMFGAASQRELVGTAVRERFRPEYQARIGERLRILMEEGRRVPEEEESCLRLDGSEFTALISAVPFEQAGKKGAIMTLRDVTERKAAEKERERLATAIDQAGEAVMITDSAAKIQYVNPAFERVTGYSRAEVMGKTPSLLKSGAQDKAFYDEMWRTLSAGRPWTGRMINRRKDGRLFTEDAVISPVKDAAGTVANYVAVKRDVTEQLGLEERLRQSQKMESIGLLAGGVAHDFNNLLTGITGYAGMLKKSMPPGAPGLGDLNEILYAAERASELTKQLLIFSRREAAKPVAMDINEGVRSSLRLVGRLIGENIKLETELAPGACVTRMDPGHFAQVLVNLAVNARDAMPRGGTLRIVTRSEPPGADAGPGAQGTLVLEVSDTGCGMPPEVLSRIFEPFFTTKERGKGTGLGLPTVYGIVEQAGGELRVSSEPGRGTSFWIHLPKARLAPAERTVAGAETGPGGGRGETVLLVEDEERLRVLGQRMLEAGGYKVVSAGGGKEALEKAAAFGRPFDAVVSDLVLPGMNGRELAAELSRRGLASRFLYVSGYTDELISRHGVLEDGVAFLNKPFTPYSLTSKLREVLDGAPEKARP